MQPLDDPIRKRPPWWSVLLHSRALLGFGVPLFILVMWLAATHYGDNTKEDDREAFTVSLIGAAVICLPIGLHHLWCMFWLYRRGIIVEGQWTGSGIAYRGLEKRSYTYRVDGELQYSEASASIGRSMDEQLHVWVDPQKPTRHILLD